MSDALDQAFDDDPLAPLRQSRERFLQGFPARCSSIELLADTLSSVGTAGPVRAFGHIVHQMAGLAGTIGFPGVSERASDLEQLVVAIPTIGVDRATLHAAILALRQAFDHDALLPLPEWAIASAGAVPIPATVVVVEDDPALRGLVSAWLRQAGHRPVALGSGERVLDVARFESPSLILLDVELPGADGYAICRRLKASGDLAAIPVAFMTTRGGLDDRANGLALGADDFLQKPLDPRDLMLRVNRLVKRGAAAAAAAAPKAAAMLTYDAFLLAAQETCEVAAASLALVRLPSANADRIVETLVNAFRAASGETGRRDLIGHYDRAHVVALLPGLSSDAARRRMEERLGPAQADGSGPSEIGVASARAGQRAVESLLAEADEALTQARAARMRALKTPSPSTEIRVVLADDDPNVVRIVEAQMRHAGYRTFVVFDGAAAVEAVAARKPALIILDLMMPKQTGFDVLQQIRAMATPPRIVVLSGRGREEDVTRAFDLGADDYVTKPFNPQELMMRVARLLR